MHAEILKSNIQAAKPEPHESEKLPEIPKSNIQAVKPKPRVKKKQLEI